MKTCLSFLAFLCLAAICRAETYQDISLADLKAAMASKNVTIIDVNGSERYAKGHIPGAIDYMTHVNDLAKLLPSNKSSLIVAYCGNEHCGAYALAAQAASKLGYTNVEHFKPGIAGWEAANQPTEK
jgi:rhodanese-related sulfurtransferase